MRLAGSSLAVAAGLAAAVAGYFALVPPSPANKVLGGTSAVRLVWTEVNRELDNDHSLSTLRIVERSHLATAY